MLHHVLLDSFATLEMQSADIAICLPGKLADKRAEPTDRICVFSAASVTENPTGSLVLLCLCGAVDTSAVHDHALPALFVALEMKPADAAIKNVPKTGRTRPTQAYCGRPLRHAASGFESM